MDTILIHGCGLKSEQILMTSLRETGVPTGKNLFETLRRTAAASPLVVALISPTYVTRPTCLAELGAAWVKDVLFPIMVGGVRRTDLNGVLQGLLIEKHDDEDTLDELQERIVQEFGVSTKQLTWSRQKKNWRKNAIQTTLTQPDIFTADDKEKLERKLGAVQEELDALTAEFDEINEQNEQLRNVKDADEVKSIVAPKSATKRFEQLLETAQRAIAGVVAGYATSDILRTYFAGRLELPNRGDSLYDGYFEARDHGLITIDDEDGDVLLNLDFYKLREAVDSIDELILVFDDETSNDDFKNWFVEKYRTTPTLTAQKTWKKLLG